MNSAKDFFEKYNLHLEGATIIVGVSGGPDSMALLNFLHTRFGRTSVIIAAHVDHSFRGAASEEDKRFVQTYCETERITCETVKIDVSAYAETNRLNKQAAARECRYRFFKDLMVKHQADYLALAHHGDDQVETMLMRLAKGTLGAGLAGMQPVRKFEAGWLIRPFLSITKEEVLTYCLEHDVSYRTDESNAKDDYTRNRFRKAVLPFLKQESHDVHRKFQKVSEALTEDEQYLQSLTKDEMNKVITSQSETSVELNSDALLALPMPLQRRGVQLILNYLYENVPSSFSARHIQQFLEWAKNGSPSGVLDFPNGLKVVKSYQTCLFTFEQLQCKEVPFEYQISGAAGETVILPGGSQITVERDAESLDEIGNAVFITSQDKVRFPLTVRTRRIGDRMKLKGMNGSKKVKDIFIDKKLPLQMRDSWPIVTDAIGEIIWIPGLKKSIFEDLVIPNGDRIVLQYRQHEMCRGQAKS
ncbi:tRNA lysidine(34) synthetase TilS [Bacillus atrophaeus]|uniref:tRNA lysidine(34) synthetase TilS n=1 Tax=Bacillus atrophaeus TaxID=1452 RepID=UPI003872CD31